MSCDDGEEASQSSVTFRQLQQSHGITPFVGSDSERRSDRVGSRPHSYVTINATAAVLPTRSQTDVRAKVGTTVELDGLRAVAAWLVFLIHYISLAQLFLRDPYWKALAYSAAQVGYLGVELFFVLSGYLVYGIVADGHTTAGRFLSRRLTKILPTFWLVLALYVVVGTFKPDFAKISLPNDWVLLIENILLLPGVYRVPAIVTVSWSLSYEIHFYLLLLLVHVTGIIRITTRRQRIIFLAAIALVIGYGAVAIGQRTLEQFALFVPGMIAWEIVAARIDAPKPTKPIALIAFFLLIAGLAYRSVATSSAIYAATGIALPGPILSVILVGIPTSIVIFRTALGDKSTRFILGNRLLVAGGRVSYSFYLTHAIVLHALMTVVKKAGLVEMSPLVAVLGFVPTLVLAHFVAQLVYERVEEPAMRMKFARRVVVPAR